LPLGLLPDLEKLRRDQAVLAVFGQLAGDATREQARAELSAISANVGGDRPTVSDQAQPAVLGFTASQVGDIQQGPLVALGMAVFVLLIACSNVANLLLARSTGRGREIAIRASLGATRWRIVRQLMVESVMLSIAGTAGAIWVSSAGAHYVAAVFGRNVPYWMHFSIDLTVLAVLAGICVVSAVILGLGPALIGSRTGSRGLMAEGGRSSMAPRVRRWTRALLIAELAVTVTLLAGAGLLVRSFLAVYGADRVIEPSKILTMEIALPEREYRSADRRTAFYERLDDRLRRGGRLSAALASARPFTGGRSQEVSFGVSPAVAGESRPSAVVIAVGPNYFEALQVSLARGRNFNTLDGKPGHDAAIVNKRFVELFSPAGDPIGQTIRVTDAKADPSASPWLTIVGIAPTIRQSVATGTQPVVYLPLAAHTGSRMSIIVGRLSDSAGVVPYLRRELAALDSGVTLFNVRPLADLLADSRLQPRVMGTITAAFAGIALLLSVVGLYAFTSYAVRQRKNEIGVRMALGAKPVEVVRLLVWTGMRPLVIGLAVGLIGAYGVGQLLRGLLIQTNPTDPVTLAFITALLVAVSVAACFLPARKAAKLNPIVVLRHE
jgi:predicted permease